MLSPDQEYLQETDRLSAPRDRRNFAMLSAWCTMLAVLHASSRELGDALIFGCLAVAASLSAIRAQLLLDDASPKPTVEPALGGYRDAVQPTESPTKYASPRRLFMAVYFTGPAVICLQRDGIGPWGLVAMGFATVMLLQHLHAAWKKRHDAKLMVEWEQRLERMK